MTPEVKPDGYFVLRHHVLVNLQFHRIDLLQLEGFNHQNVLNVIRLAESIPATADEASWTVEFETSYGVSALFQCKGIEVASVVPCTQSGEPLATIP